MTTSPIGFPPQRTPALLRSLLTDLRVTGDIRREEAVTGRVADQGLALGGRVAEVLSLEREIRRIGEYRQSIALTETRAAAAQRVLGNLQSLATDVTNAAQLALQSGGIGGLETVSREAADMLQTAAAALNSRVGGRSLFAGDQGDAPALATADQIFAEVRTLIEAAPDSVSALNDVTLAFNAPGGTFETTLYLGGTGDAPASEIAEGERVAYQARADEQPFRDLLAGLATIAAAFDPEVAIADEDRKALMEQAVRDLRNTIDPLNRVVARIGVAEGRIAETKARMITEESALTQAINGFTGADTLVAATELQAAESQLEILFLTTARFSQLTLSNFIR